MHDPEVNKALAMLVIRIVAGVLFFMQAYDRLFNVRIEGVLNAFGDMFTRKGISRSFQRSIVILTSYTELAGGLMLMLGLFKYVALYILGIDLLFAAVAFSLIKPMWDMQYYFPRLVFVIALLLLPVEWDVFTIDYLLKAGAM